MQPAYPSQRGASLTTQKLCAAVDTIAASSIINNTYTYSRSYINNSEIPFINTFLSLLADES